MGDTPPPPGGRRPRRIVSYFGNRYADHFRRDAEEIRAHGFDTVVHCVTEADLEHSMGAVARIFAATKEAGLACWADPWAVAGVFGGEAHSGFLQRGGRACTGEPAFLDLLRRWTDAVAEAGAEWVFWDEPNLRCECCGERVVELLDTLSAYAAARGMRSSVCLVSTEPNVQRIDEVAALPAVHDVSSDPYYTFPLDDTYDADAYVGRWATVVGDAARRHGIGGHLWVQGFGIPEGSEHVVADAVAAARAAGMHDLAFWGFRACEATSTIEPARRELVWEMAGELYGQP